MRSLSTIKTAILVDDEKVDHMLYKRLIDRSGLIEKAICFQYPDEALEFLKQPDCKQIDVLFLDINMPRMNGFEFLDRALAEIGPEFTELVVVMLTTSLNPRDEEKAASYDVVKDYINKPMTIEVLQHVLVLLNDKAHTTMKAAER